MGILTARLPARIIRKRYRCRLRELIWAAAASLLGLEEENGAVPEVEVDEVFRLCIMSATTPDILLVTLTMRDEASEVPANHAVPCRTLA